MRRELEAVFCWAGVACWPCSIGQTHNDPITTSSLSEGTRAVLLAMFKKMCNYWECPGFLSRNSTLNWADFIEDSTEIECYLNGPAERNQRKKRAASPYKQRRAALVSAALEIPSRPGVKATRPTPGQPSSGGQLPFLPRTAPLEFLAMNFCGPPYNYPRLRRVVVPSGQAGRCFRGKALGKPARVFAKRYALPWS